MSPMSTTNTYLSYKAFRVDYLCKDIIDFNKEACLHHKLKHNCCLKHTIPSYRVSNRRMNSIRHCHMLSKYRRVVRLSPQGSKDDGIVVNGNSPSISVGDMEEIRIKFDQSLHNENISDGLIQSLNDAARVFERGIKSHSSSKVSWFSKAWLGVDKNTWIKTLSYQAAVHSLLQAANEISSQVIWRDRDVNAFVQRSLLRQSAPLESIIRDELSSKQPAAYDWFWSEQHPTVVASFISYFEKDPRFSAATENRKGIPVTLGNANDLSVIILALICISAVTKLGSGKVCCSQFFSMIPDITGSLMDMLADFVPICEVYNYMKDIGLVREFLLHFGPRAAGSRVKNDSATEEISFWVEFLQKQLQRAIDRERIWSRLTTSESIEVLEKDLAIFGFFIALGRSTKAFLSSNGFDVIDEPMESFIRYLIGGSVLCYPQLSSISSYQLYVEVVCEELEWLPFYPKPTSLRQSHDNKGNVDGISKGEAITRVLNVCSHWMQSFIKYSTWLQNPSNVKAAKFLSRGHILLQECMEEVGLARNETRKGVTNPPNDASTSNMDHSQRELDSFDKALENVEEAVKRLEKLLQELHVSSSDPGREHLKAACSDLERIRKLKKEAEFLEASFRAKAASLEQGGDDDCLSVNKERQLSKQRNVKGSKMVRNRNYLMGSRRDRNSRGMWSFLVHRSIKKAELEESKADPTVDELMFHTAPCGSMVVDQESSDIHRFELLRNELIELEKQVQRSANGFLDEENNLQDGDVLYLPPRKSINSVEMEKKDDIIGESLAKLKETTADIWQGTQLLGIDVVAALILIQRALTGDELTEKEKQALRRTSTDLASVVPIGILMLLPVTAVGHAAMLAAIQRYVPQLIPSTYGPERLYLLRQLEKVKEMEATGMNMDEVAESSSLSRSTPGKL